MVYIYEIDSTVKVITNSYTCVLCKSCMQYTALSIYNFFHFFLPPLTCPLRILGNFVQFLPKKRRR